MDPSRNTLIPKVVVTNSKTIDDWNSIYKNDKNKFNEIILSTKRAYTGELNTKGLPEGKGISWYKPGCPRYSGIWKDGRQHGKGAYYYSTPGSIFYIGGIYKRVPHGIGIEFNLDGSVSYLGYWIKGKKADD